MNKTIFGLIKELIDENIINIVKIENISELNYAMFNTSKDKRITKIVFKNKKEAIEKILYCLMKYKIDKLKDNGFNENKDIEWLEKIIKYYLNMEVERVDEICTDLRYKKIIFENNGKKYLNMFKTARVFEEKIEIEDTNFKNIQKIIRNLCGDNQEYYDYFMDWLAHMIQYPEVRVTNGIIFAGYYGSGKGELTDILKIIMEDTLQIVQADMFKQKWNDFLEGKILIIGNEIAYVSNDERYYVANKLKSIITDIDIQIEGKFEPIRNSKNYARVIVFSNDKAPIVIQNGDRRYFVVTPKTTLLDNEDYNTKGLYTSEEYNAWKGSEEYNKEIQVFSKHLQERVVDKNIAYKAPPMTYEKKQIIGMNETMFKNEVIRVLAGLVIENKATKIDEEIMIDFKRLYDSFIVNQKLKEQKYKDMSEIQFKSYIFIHCDIMCKYKNEIMYCIINKNVFKQVNDYVTEKYYIDNGGYNYDNRS